MKKFSFAAAIAVAAMMASCGNGTPKADMRENVDTLSYAMGMMQSQGLKEYATQRLGVDSIYMDEFIKGINDGANASNNKKKAAYYEGVKIGSQVSQQIISGMNQELFNADSTKTVSLKNFLAGFISGTTGKGNLMTTDEANALVQRLRKEVKAQYMEEKYGEWKKENIVYLAEIAKKEGVQKLSEGVYYKVIEEGKGAIPTNENTVEVDYEGKLINDTIFDSSYKRGESTKFRTTQVITGWSEALTHMPVGSKWKVYISADKGYGERHAGDIMPFSTLIFTIELKSIVDENKK